MSPFLRFTNKVPPARPTGAAPPSPCGEKKPKKNQKKGSVIRDQISLSSDYMAHRVTWVLIANQFTVGGSVVALPTLFEVYILYKANPKLSS